MLVDKLSLFAAVGLAPLLAAAQLSGSVGPLTSASTKAATKTCNVLDYGAKADKSTDLGTPLASAFADCKTGGLVYIPEGDYAMSTWVKLAGGSAWALQLDGTIYRDSTEGGNMIMIEHTSDFELFSSNSKGAIQGLGYELHKDDNYSGPRLLRVWDTTDFSVHDIILVDSPAFHFSIDTCTNGEVYNMAIRGGNHGGLDGIDVWSDNIWIHDIEVTNKDECVTVKSPAHNILVENIYCNWSGGCGMGSFGTDTNVTDITYRNIYTWNSNNMMLIKSNGGSGFIENVVLENFIGHGNAYSLDIDSAWASMSTVEGDGIQMSNFTIKNWKGTEEYGLTRGPIKMICPTGAPCYDITIEDFAMWTEKGSVQWYSCQSAYGSGFCLKDSDDHAAYSASTTTVSSAPSGYSATTMAGDLTAAFDTTLSIPIPTIPTSFYPGATPYSALMSLSSSGASHGTPATSAARATSSATSSATSVVKSSSSSTSEYVAATSAAEFVATTAVSSAQEQITSAPSSSSSSSKHHQGGQWQQGQGWGQSQEEDVGGCNA
ncbi:rhamnogalacturonase rhgB [Aspergillus japonicus CBS 114.51]|uniref:rhamnogalacturonan hydrolase n=1 Tax=Aspergillus japonicus CBS 114.51 TaxID=1448312 RepID=A0A8T8X2B0_ASPJA|nr:rhamnogalacturonase rhgB [Aspergillus japonicus CBS 114.51]RAH82243.1 rhamnogalacturonase rhgB [Aspergillus japonicus CBS 114.51]